MDEKLVGSSSEVQAHENVIGVAFDWRLNFVTQRFECEESAAYALFGVEIFPITTKQLIQWLPISQRKKAIDAFRQVLTTGVSQRYQCALVTPLNIVTFVEFDIERQEENQLAGTVTPLLLLRDADEVAELFYRLFENDHHGILVTDEETRILACNAYFERLTGYHRRDLIGLKSRIFNADKHSEHFYQSMWHALATEGSWSGAILTRTSGGENTPQDLTIQKVTLAGRDYFIGFSADLSTHLNRLNDREKGGIDLLTQLPSKEKFLRLLEVWHQSERDKSTLLLLAIQPNFSYSTELNVKREFAQFLFEHSHNHLVGYLGNDRFVVGLEIEHHSHISLIRQVRQRMKRFFHGFKQAKGEVSQALTQGKTGVSVLGVDAKTPAALFTHANQALLEMHSGQQRHISFYDHAMHLQIEKKKRLETLLLECIEQKTIEVHYQPIIDLQQWRVDKFEALCRFPPALSQEASVQELINIAEDLDMIEILDQQVARQALSDLEYLQCCFGPQVGISFNRSISSSTGVSQLLMQTALLIDESGVQPDQVTVEITENAYFESEEHKADGLKLLRKAGVSVAVDDFGTGYSSFQYLTQCHFDVLKIDRAFVQNIRVNSNQYRIVRSLTELSHQLGLRVVAEGVESETELQILAQIGVDCVQGYFFAKPFALKSDAQQQFEALSLASYQKKYGSKGCVCDLATPATPHLDPGDPISLAFEYLQRDELNIIPVVDGRKCVGFVDREAMNLHLTPGMGTELETMKEAGLWNKRVNQVMVLNFSTLHWHTQMSALAVVINQLELFPWVMVDDDGDYKGVIEMHSVLKHLRKNLS